EPAPVADHPARGHRPQPDLGRAHVPVLRRRRDAGRLAPRAPRRPCGRRGRRRAHRGHRREPRGAHQPAGHRHLDRRAGAGVVAHGGLRAGAGRARRHPARARRTQGQQPAAVGGTRRRRSRGRRVGAGGPHGRGVPRPRATDGARPRRDRTGAGRLRRRDAPCADGRLRPRRAPRRSRLPAARVPVAAVEHPHRRVRRRPRRTHAARPRGRRGRACRVAAGPPAGPAHLRQRLGRGRLDRRRLRRAREGGGGPWRRPRRLLVGREQPRPVDHPRPRLPGAVRRAGAPRRGGPVRRGRAHHRCTPGRAGPRRGLGRRRAAGPRAAARSALAAARRGGARRRRRLAGAVRPRPPPRV
ncbi:MAG: NADH:flavin oxidoreductases, Old Yellow Enzyme family, partial [uncultured Frankineae bacterium]